MFKSISNYLSLVKFSHTIFAMPFAMIGFFLAVVKEGQVLHWQLLLLVILCMVFARSAAMAFNRWLDMEFDQRNPRTAMREIPAGIIAPGHALAFVVANAFLFVLTTLFINRLCFFLSPVALLVILGYSYTKRLTPLCHLILGLGLSLAPIGAFLSVTGHFALLPVLFSLVVLTWVSGFDIIYALQDEEFDRSQQLHSIPAWLGRVKALRLSKWLHLLSGILVIDAGWIGSFGAWYWTGAALFFGLLVYQHWLVKPHDLSKVNLAFATTNGMASLLFAVMVITDLFLKP